MGGKRSPPDNSRREIVARLEMTRQALGLSPSELARRWGISPQLVHNYRSNLDGISLKSALKLCASIGVTLDWIYRGEMGGLPASLANKIQAQKATHKD